MSRYAGTKTEKNLEAAFSGESQARNKYTYFASVAKKEGYEQIAALFLKTADNEKEHAKLWFKELDGISDTAANLAAAAAGEKADVIFMDPPREGSTPEFLASVARMAPKRVVYVSCNPVTLARDLATLTKLGYKAEGFTPVDMFPHTEHIETVCALSKLDIHGKKPSGRR